jgi:hypothetical protein
LSTPLVQLLDQVHPGAVPAAPQWGVIEQITTGDVLLAIGQRDGATAALLAGLHRAEAARLPHQAQRALRLAVSGGLNDVTEIGRATVDRLRLSAPAVDETPVTDQCDRAHKELTCTDRSCDGCDGSPLRVTNPSQPPRRRSIWQV